MRNSKFNVIITFINNRISVNQNMNYQRTFCLPFQ